MAEQLGPQIGRIQCRGRFRTQPLIPTDDPFGNLDRLKARMQWPYADVDPKRNLRDRVQRKTPNQRSYPIYGQRQSRVQLRQAQSRRRQIYPLGSFPQVLHPEIINESKNARSTPIYQLMVADKHLEAAVLARTDSEPETGSR